MKLRIAILDVHMNAIFWNPTNHITSSFGHSISELVFQHDFQDILCPLKISEISRYHFAVLLKKGMLHGSALPQKVNAWADMDNIV